MFSFVRKLSFSTKVVIGAVAVIGIGIGAYVSFHSSGDGQRELVTAKKGDIHEEVVVTGKVKPAHDVDLAFEKGGRVTRVAFAVGDAVRAGAVLAELDHADLSASLLEAQASVREREAALAALERGSRPEEISVTESKLASAQQAQKDARQNAVNYIQDAYTKADDAVGGKIDQFYLNPKTVNPQFLFANLQLKTDAESKRVITENTMQDWKKKIDGGTIANNFDGAFSLARTNLAVIRDLLDTVSQAINSLAQSATISQATINTYRADVSAARANINTAFTNLTTAEEKLSSADSAVGVSERELDLVKAGSAAEDIESATAALEQAKASVANIQAQIQKTLIIAPISGVVTRSDIKAGEIVGANSKAISLETASQFQIEANVPEADIAKIQSGNSAHVTLDAYGSGKIFDARVIAIDPSETVIDGVSTYKATLEFSGTDDRVKSGMTANVTILGAAHEGVVVIPLRAVTTKDGQKIVRVMHGNEVEEKSVSLGLRGQDGLVEITSGISEGDIIVVSSSGI